MQLYIKNRVQIKIKILQKLNGIVYDGGIKSTIEYINYSKCLLLCKYKDELNEKMSDM